MALHIFTEINGQRVETTDLPRTSEYACDACGEFLSPQELASVHFQVHSPAAGTSVRTYETHTRCLPKLLDALAQALVTASLVS